MEILYIWERKLFLLDINFNILPEEIRSEIWKLYKNENIYNIVIEKLMKKLEEFLNITEWPIKLDGIEEDNKEYNILIKNDISDYK